MRFYFGDKMLKSLPSSARPQILTSSNPQTLRALIPPVFEPLLALVPPAPVRAPLCEPLTLIRQVRAMTFGEILSIRAIFTPVPDMVVAPVRIVDAVPDGRMLVPFLRERARRDDHRRRQRRRHEQGRKHSPHKVDLLSEHG